MDDLSTKRYSPAAERNRVPVLSVLAEVLPPAGTVLEVASGSGQHVAFLAPAFPFLRWQPSDIDATSLASIAAWSNEVEGATILPPILLDASAASWPLVHADAIVCLNMIHIAPWKACEGLIAGAGRILPEGAPLYIYGPFKREGVETAASNLSFDESLRSRNPAWGLRHLEDVTTLASHCGLQLERVVEMPANNVSVVYRRLSPK